MSTHHLVNDSIQRHELTSDSTLHVIGVISNPVRFHSRYRIAREWIEQMERTKNVQLHLVEIAHGDRHHEVTDRLKVNHLQLRSSEELWQKEAMINQAVTRLLPRDWKYMAWIDADVWFSNHNWALETIQELQHYRVVQPWGEAIDLGPHNNVVQVFTSFASLINRGETPRAPKSYGTPYSFGHPGFAWACTRDFYEGVERLLDFPILGSADSHMAWAMIGRVDESIYGKASDSFKRLAREWQTKAFRTTHGHLGYVPGHITHRWHGKKKNRFYVDRWKILAENKFDPDHDIVRDHQGVWRFAGNKPKLVEACRRYFRAREEDSIEEE
jgi:hypothetical protein